MPDEDKASFAGRRLACSVPFCRRTCRNSEGYTAWVCGKHWSTVSRNRRAILNRRKRQEGWTQRTLWLWERCRDEAIEKAAGIV